MQTRTQLAEAFVEETHKFAHVFSMNARANKIKITVPHPRVVSMIQKIKIPGLGECSLFTYKFLKDHDIEFVNYEKVNESALDGERVGRIVGDKLETYLYNTAPNDTIVYQIKFARHSGNVS